MTAPKILLFVVLAYVAVVVIAESMLGFFQPEFQRTLIITTTDASGNSTDRVLVSNYTNNQLYISANHWPRAWYHETLDNPNVQVTTDEVTAEYLAVPVSGAEHELVNTEHAHGLGFRFLVGFAPRCFIRLDPK